MDTPAESKESLVLLLRMRIPDNEGAFFAGLPPRNNIGGCLLLELLHSELQVKGVKVEWFTGNGPLNSVIICFYVWDVQAAVKVIQGALERLQLWPFTTLHYWDEREDFFRPFHFGAGVDPEEPFDPKALLAENAAHMKDYETRKRIVQQVIDMLPKFELPTTKPPAPPQP